MSDSDVLYILMSVNIIVPTSSSLIGDGAAVLPGATQETYFNLSSTASAG